MVALLGVLVAGGRGARLGLGVPKALVTIGGRTLFDRALGALCEVCGQVVVAAPRDMALPVDPLLRVADLGDDGGPLAGLLAALCARPFERALVLGVDYPLMDARALRGLVAGFDHAEAARGRAPAAFVPIIDGRRQPLAAIYHARAVAPLRSYFDAGGRGLMGALEALDDLVVADRGELAMLLACSAAGLDALINVNHPEDLVTAAARLGQGVRR